MSCYNNPAMFYKLWTAHKKNNQEIMEILLIVQSYAKGHNFIN